MKDWDYMFLDILSDCKIGDISPVIPRKSTENLFNLTRNFEKLYL